MYRVVYNAKYGGFGLNDIGLQEYNRRANKTIRCYDHIDRDDSHLIDMVETMGNIINKDYSKLKIKEFPMKYKEFLLWSDYDGMESVTVDYDKYLIYHIKWVKNNNMLTSDEKMNQIETLYTEYDSRPKNILEVKQDEELNKLELFFERSPSDA